LLMYPSRLVTRGGASRLSSLYDRRGR
jgi:hypothetical protein